MYLDRIVETKKAEVAALAERFHLSEAESAIAKLPDTRGFERALADRSQRSLGLIAEVKKASPSKGLIRPDFHPVEIAKAYEQAGADCISVLTDVQYFQGSDRYLQDIRQAVQLPLLRKDFIIDERQIYEARLLGADAVLLIAAILDTPYMGRLLETARSLGLDALVEVHDRREMEAALSLGTASLIGINNRNLHTFETRLETTAELAAMAPSDVTLISESGIMQPGDLPGLQKAGAKGILVGEYFMRQPVIEDAVSGLMGAVETSA
ncbi:indole-3-glycerol phosphate synthase TrpC [Paenibacillus sp. JX-17]|uniref:Indole-3-glycerol phosphate synthase n=1 Tax=Paenibacillus lacisoli TaxID=3064525 RepID=A0ABT9CAM0_9BACL|nr:indole-3-glycerol phosphate synthase TrpC [Paenibacillus sp. JX-17]MDO7905067.1 indole-3-glycerol phosphate synthase TrpC [Paenibacillus sp. JX-17]